MAKAAKWGLEIGGFAVVDVKNNSAFHFNASLTAVNLAKKDWMKGNEQHKPFSMANYKTLYNNTLMLELFIRRFAA